jgi:hypothetical protein
MIISIVLRGLRNSEFVQFGTDVLSIVKLNDRRHWGCWRSMMPFHLRIKWWKTSSTKSRRARPPMCWSPALIMGS